MDYRSGIGMGNTKGRRMILTVVPLWLLILTLCAKGLNIVRGAWQVRCTQKKGYPVLPMSCLCFGMVGTLVGLLYYSWMCEPVGILGHLYNAVLLAVNIFYKVIHGHSKEL